MDEETTNLAFAYEEKACRDIECDGVAEQEKADEYFYWVCGTCGFEFGYEQVPAALRAESNACAIGVPVSLQQAAQVSPESNAVSVSIGKRRDG